MCVSKRDITVETAYLAQLRIYLRVYLAAVLCAAIVISSPFSYEIKYSKFSLSRVNRFLELQWNDVYNKTSFIVG